MNTLHQAVLYSAIALVQMTGLAAPPSDAPRLGLKSSVIIRRGSHPWYEVKVDPENSKNLIVCGTKLDPLLDALFGFVYSSTDGGKTWRAAMEDRNSLWVTEQSCAFGPSHRVYFVSEASKVIGGILHHELGTTRLYVSTDAGQSWTETTRTGWADYSTSAVSSASGKLYTFFNTIAGEQGRTWGSNVGILVFSTDGSTVDGPFFDSTIQDLAYDGTFPSASVGLKSGSIVALYYGTRATSTGTEADLGILRAQPSANPLPEHTVIMHTVAAQDCLNLNDSSLAYDYRENRLLVVYVHGCQDRQITLVSSGDEGRTWQQSAVIGSYPRAANPSLVVTSGVLGLLWEDGEGSGKWLLSRIQNQKLLQPATQLSPDQDDAPASNDSLLTWIYQANEHHGGNPEKPSESSITVSVVNMFDIVWRASGATAVGDDVLVVWPSGDSNGMRLYSAVFKAAANFAPIEAAPQISDESDVTDDTVIFYGGTEHFDVMTGNLNVCLKLGNQGRTPIRVPIELEVKDVSSPLGTISILNATNGQRGVDAIWDISNAVTGSQIPPRTTSNPFCLSFRLDIPPRRAKSLPPDDLLVLKLRVLASKANLPEHPMQSKARQP